MSSLTNGFLPGRKCGMTNSASARGISLTGYNDIKERDIIESYELEEVAATL